MPIAPKFKDTMGGKRARVAFDLSQPAHVKRIKRNAAEAINLIEKMREKNPAIAAKAQSAFELGAKLTVDLISTK